MAGLIDYQKWLECLREFDYADSVGTEASIQIGTHKILIDIADSLAKIVTVLESAKKEAASEEAASDETENNER